MGVFNEPVGVARKLAKLPAGLGMYLALTGDRLTGFDVYRAEITTAHVPSDVGEDIARNMGQMQTRYSTQVHHSYYLFSHLIHLSHWRLAFSCQQV